MDKNTDKDEVKSVSMKLLFWFILIALVIFLANFIVIRYFSDWAVRGQFGDMFGLSNSLFSGLAFAGLIFAILLQRRDLELQRKELVYTRKEMEGQKEQLEAQKTQMEIQNFANRFFQLLSLLNDITDRLQFSNHQYTGRECFEECKKRLFDTYRGEFNKDQNKKTDDEIINSSFILAFSNFPAGYSNYMRVLYNIYKLIDRHEMCKSEKKFYANIVRAQLSQFELVVIFYNCLSKYGVEKFRPLIIEHAVLKHLDITGLLHESHQSKYPQKAYGLE